MSNKLGLKNQVSRIAKEKERLRGVIEFQQEEINRLHFICWCALSRLEASLPYIPQHIPRCDVEAAIDLLQRHAPPADYVG